LLQRFVSTSNKDHVVVTALPRPIAVFEGSTSKRRERGEREKEEKVKGRDLARPKNLA